MGRKITVQLIDDLDGSLIEEDEGRTVRFGFEGRNYEIDLSAANATAFFELLKPFIDNGREILRNNRKVAMKAFEETQAIREWARANGYPISDRGRIAVEVRDAYFKEHPDKQ